MNAMTPGGLNSEASRLPSGGWLWYRTHPNAICGFGSRPHVFTFQTHRWEISIANDISNTRWQRSCRRWGGLTVRNVQRSIDIVYVSRGKPVSHTHTHACQYHLNATKTQQTPSSNKDAKAASVPLLVPEDPRRHFFLYALHTGRIYSQDNMLSASLSSPEPLFSSFLELLVDFVSNRLDV